MGEPTCRRCGRCCAVKVVVEDRVIYTGEACRFYDPETKLCTVYARRHEANPDCLSLDEAIRQGVLPADCPFVAERPDYKPPIDMREFAEQLAAGDDEVELWLESDDDPGPEN